MSNDTVVAKFLPRFDGPYIFIDMHEEASTIILNLPNDPAMFPTFHISLVKLFLSNNNERYPHCFIAIKDDQDFFVEKILDHKAWGGGCYQMISRYMRKP
jgi:hypothetical protein